MAALAHRRRRSDKSWSWDEFRALPSESFTVDIHCVTSWSKLGTGWEGVSIDTLLEEVEPLGAYVMAHSYGGYTTNLPVEDLTGGKAWVAYAYDGDPLEPEHGGPARLLVPHLYLWKSAKWVRELEFIEENEPGFWESLGYHDYGDPWREQRYQGEAPATRPRLAGAAPWRRPRTFTCRGTHQLRPCHGRRCDRQTRRDL